MPRSSKRAGKVEFRVGVVGVGTRTVHGEAWARTLAEMPNVSLLRLSDDEAEPVERTARALGVQHFGTDARAVLEAKDLDVVVVNSMDHLHEGHVKAALAAGKHVLTDKPLGQDKAGAAAIAAISKKAGLKVAIGHVFRFAPQYEFVHERVQSGDLGRVFQVEAGYVHDLRRVWKLTPWRADRRKPQDPWFGGLLHPLDLVQWLAGDVTHVCAVENKASAKSEHPLPDNEICLLKFASGAVGRVWSTFGIRQNPEFQTFCNAFGDRGSCFANLQRNVVELHRDWGVGGVGGPLLVPFAAGAQLNRRLIEDFFAAIREDRPPRIDAGEGVRAMAVVEAAVKSVKTGRFEPVVVPAY